MRGEFYQQLTNDLETARAEGLFKEERIITSAQQADITVADGSHVINFLCQQLSRAGRIILI
ncbi:2-amino-3-ketobutyrate coenzyme A ligase [Escherichia coli]|nr:2-amino-3-ketobutyrate coenzyme A ligase [Escherichia coli]